MTSSKFKKALLATALVFGSAAALPPAALAQTYWRVDTGYSWSRDADIRDKNFALDGVICGDPACTVGGKLDDVDNSWILGAGVGYRFNPNVRGDVTLGYRGGYNINGTDLGVPPTTFSGDVSSTALMLNGYYDFQPLTWGTPYIGAGIGWARNKVDSITGTILGFSATVPGGTKTDFAWALMAGVSFRLNPTVTLEVGYRYIDLGKIETDFGPVTTVPAFPGLTYSGASGKLKAHELTVGLRF